MHAKHQKESTSFSFSFCRQEKKKRREFRYTQNIRLIELDNQFCSGSTRSRTLDPTHTFTIPTAAITTTTVSPFNRNRFPLIVRWIVHSFDSCRHKQKSSNNKNKCKRQEKNCGESERESHAFVRAKKGSLLIFVHLVVKPDRVRLHSFILLPAPSPPPPSPPFSTFCRQNDAIVVAMVVVN